MAVLLSDLDILAITVQQYTPISRQVLIPKRDKVNFHKVGDIMQDIALTAGGDTHHIATGSLALHIGAGIQSDITGIPQHQVAAFAAVTGGINALGRGLHHGIHHNSAVHLQLILCDPADIRAGTHAHHYNIRANSGAITHGDDPGAILQMGFLGLGTKVQLYTLSGQIFFDSLAYSLIGSCRENMRSQIGEDGMDATLQ